MLVRPTYPNINMSGVKSWRMFATPTLTLESWNVSGGSGLHKTARHPARTGTLIYGAKTRGAGAIPNRTQGQHAISTNRVAGPLLPPGAWVRMPRLRHSWTWKLLAWIW